MSVAWWALALSFVSLLIAGASFGWQIYSWRRVRRTVLEVRFGRLPSPEDDDVIWCGLEVVNHSDFAVRVQDVQLIHVPADVPDAEPLIVGLRAEGSGGLPGTVQPHDSGFVGTGIPDLVTEAAVGGRVVVYANVITAVGNMRTPAYDLDELPWFPAPMRFNRLFPDRMDASNDEEHGST